MKNTSRPLAVEIGRRLRWARDQAGLSQKEAAALVPGLENTRLSNYETGLRVLDIEIAKTLGPLYGVTAAYLLTLEDEPPNPDVTRLKALYQQADARGKQSILRTAEFEAATSSRAVQNSISIADPTPAEPGDDAFRGQKQLMTQIYEQVCGQESSE